jgi:rhodanese-related sulfurtransferase
MLNYLLICRSVTYAQRTAKALEDAGITAVVTRTPKELSIEGCSYCVRIPGRHMTEALLAIRGAGLPPARVFALSEDGIFGEVGV